ncbi:putative protease/peptidase [Pilimelia terevasa]|uniref:Putative protease/peptidase n=1 Tax=Pilimelia terevasa TaxID=53372 RepID=A0A8J3FH99_9ACTN|nr:site-2 protease family protein [Pilimelia terevasa]GGK27922.1 putative protease/peptidase [Pilimelia terevasa]
MKEILGILAFALLILVSVSLHEAGHMATAKMFGMKVTRFFVGFGPTLWSFRRGETEYGVKGIPLGGFVKIVGMTAQDDDVEPGDERRAMWRYPVWKRTVVMSAGSAVHFLLALVATWAMAMTLGLPNRDLPDDPAALPAYVKISECVVVAHDPARSCQPGDPASPAGAAGLRDNDRITAIDGRPVGTFGDLLTTTRTVPPGPVTISFERDGQPRTARVDLAAVQRPPAGDPAGAPRTVSAMGVGLTLPPGTKTMITYGPGAAVGATGDFTGFLAGKTVEAMKRFPEKIPALWTSLTGGERDVDTPISVVGASRLGGEAVAHDAWEMFLFLFISLNFFVGLFNLLPLLPLDGGHIAISWYEKLRSVVYARIGRRDPGRVDYAKLMPLTYGVILIFGAFTLLTVAADIVNPITMFR